MIAIKAEIDRVGAGDWPGGQPACNAPHTAACSRRLGAPVLAPRRPTRPVWTRSKYWPPVRRSTAPTATATWSAPARRSCLRLTAKIRQAVLAVGPGRSTAATPATRQGGAVSAHCVRRSASAVPRTCTPRCGPTGHRRPVDRVPPSAGLRRRRPRRRHPHPRRRDHLPVLREPGRASPPPGLPLVRTGRGDRGTGDRTVGRASPNTAIPTSITPSNCSAPARAAPTEALRK